MPLLLDHPLIPITIGILDNLVFFLYNLNVRFIIILRGMLWLHSVELLESYLCEFLVEIDDGGLEGWVVDL